VRRVLGTLLVGAHAALKRRDEVPEHREHGAVPTYAEVVGVTPWPSTTVSSSDIESA